MAERKTVTDDRGSESDIPRRGPRRVPWTRLALVGLLATASFGSALAQPSSSEEVVWNRLFRMPDGRVFVTDGAMMLDESIAMPQPVPSLELPASTGDTMQQRMTIDRPDEFTLRQLQPGSRPNTYEAPNGTLLAAKYVELLRDTVPGASLRIGNDLDGVVIVHDGAAVGLVMPVSRGVVDDHHAVEIVAYPQRCAGHRIPQQLDVLRRE